MNNNKVVVAMSGGVDSAVAAFLLREKGYEVIGITMQVWPNDSLDDMGKKSCCSLSAVEDARRVADLLDIPFYVLNFREIFEEKVIQYFMQEYLDGKTPNPCIACNRFIKFEELLKRALQLEAFYIATGHYAAISRDRSEERYALYRAADTLKDQTYALYSLTQYQLEHTLMPLGDYTKVQIREIAKKIGLKIAGKPDSQEICFVPDQNYGKFIESRLCKKIEQGNFVDLEGNILGVHKGIVNYTIGQRKGLGISGQEPYYVVRLDIEKNRVVLGRNKDVFSKRVLVKDINVIASKMLADSFDCTVKIRYGVKESSAFVHRLNDDTLEVLFEEPQRAATPGQAAVFYDGRRVLGGGTIVNNYI